MDMDEMADSAEWQMYQLKNYAIQYARLQKEGRKTHMKAKMIRRRMEGVKCWFRSIELQLKEDEKS